MTRFEKIIVVALCLLSLSFLGYMTVSWTSQGTPAAAAPGAHAAAKVDPSKVDLLADRHRAAKQLKDRSTVIRDKRIILCSRLPPGYNRRLRNAGVFDVADARHAHVIASPELTIVLGMRAWRAALGRAGVSPEENRAALAGTTTKPIGRRAS
jgi:hypothetical protein